MSEKSIYDRAYEEAEEQINQGMNPRFAYYEFSKGWQLGFKAALRDMEQLEYTEEFKTKFPTVTEQEHYFDVVTWFVNVMQERAFGRVLEKPVLENDKMHNREGLVGVSSGTPANARAMKEQKQ